MRERKLRMFAKRLCKVAVAVSSNSAINVREGDRQLTQGLAQTAVRRELFLQ